MPYMGHLRRRMKPKEIPEELFVEDRRPKNSDHDSSKVWAGALLIIVAIIFYLIA